MRIRRACVLDEGERYVFVQPEGLATNIMWANRQGLHVQSGTDSRIWTVYPLDKVLWYEEER